MIAFWKQCLNCKIIQIGLYVLRHGTFELWNFKYQSVENEFGRFSPNETPMRMQKSSCFEKNVQFSHIKDTYTQTTARNRCRLYQIHIVKTCVKVDTVVSRSLVYVCLLAAVLYYFSVKWIIIKNCYGFIGYLYIRQ